MPCLALPCHVCVYIYIVWCRGGVCKLQFLYCFSSPRAGFSAWHLRPSTLCGERSEHGWRPLFLGQRSLACFADCKWFSIRAHFRIIWKHLFIILYISLCFPMFFLHNHAVKLTSLHFRLQQGFLNNLDLGPQDLVLPTWCLWTWDCIATDKPLRTSFGKNSWLFWFSFAATNVLNESARTLFLLTVSAVSGTV